ncbi:MAG: Hpt domain-containing protein [bacterium]
MAESGGIDPKALEHLTEIGGAAFTVKMIDLFLESGGQRLAEARAHEKQGDWAGVQRAVHSMRSSAGNFGAQRVFELAGQIEQLAMAGQSGSIPDLLQQLEEGLNRIQDQLRQERARLIS